MNIKETNPSANIPKQPADAPLGDRGSEKTWQPPPDKQGISNREGDEDFDTSAPEPRKASS
jgi:hypothetical protein